MKPDTALAVAAGVLLAIGVAGRAAAGNTTEYVYSVAPFAPSFTAPAAGSYELPPIAAVGDHPLVDAAGVRTTLARLVGDRIAVVSFFYGTCSEKNGCPLATAVLHGLDRRIVSSAGAGENVALVSISFDRVGDTTERLATMQRMRADGSAWSFATAPDDASLDALLGDFGQTVSKLRSPDGKPTGTFRHVLKVYLVDRRRAVRNIYSVGFLDPDLVWNDIETLRLEDTRNTPARRASGRTD